MRPTDPEVRLALAPARVPLAGVLAGSLAGAALTIGQAFAIAHFLVSAVNREALAGPAVWLGAVFASKALVGALTDGAAARAAARVSTALRHRLLVAFLEPRGVGAGEAAGARTALLTRGVQAAEPYLTRYLPALLLSVVVPPLVVSAIATEDLLSAAIVVLTLPLLPVFGALVGLATRDKAAQQWRAMESLSGHFLDVMKGLPTLVAFRRAEAQTATIRAVSDRYRRRSVETLKIAFASSAVLELVATLSVALVAVVVGVRLAEGGLDLMTGLVVLLLAPEAYAPIRRAGAEFHAAAEGAATFERVASLELAGEPYGGACAEGSLVARGLSVTYPGSNNRALSPVDIEFPATGLTAIVGRSGSGKSTLLAALADVIAADGERLVGNVRVGGPLWQAAISWLPQRPVLQNATIAANLRLAAPDADDDQLWDALEEVDLARRVAANSLALQMEVGEDGSELSGGERARLALARVLLARRAWALVDEPTAHLDPATRTAIIAVLRRLSRDTGVVVATHDAELIQAADKVVRLPCAAAVTEPVRPAVAPVEARTAPRAPEPIPDLRPHRRMRVIASNLLAAAASGSGVALTATAGWLIVRAAERPAILTMLVAIVGVRAFGLGRPVFRYAARLAGHDAALAALAERRAAVYRSVVPLAPGALGRDRGDALASIVDDVEATVDRDLRVREPLWSAVLVTAGVTSLVLLVSAQLAVVVAGACLVAGAAGFFTSYLGCRHTEAELVGRRAELSAFAAESIQIATELVMWQAVDRRVRQGVAMARGLGRVSQRATWWVGVARSLVVVCCGAGVVGAGELALATGVSGPILALVALTPLAMVDVLLPLADAGALTRRVRAAEARLDQVAARPPRVLDPIVPVPRGGGSNLVATGLAAGWTERAAFTGLDFTLGPGENLAVVGPSGCGKSTLAAAMLRFIDPLEGSISLGTERLAQLSLDSVRESIGLVDDDPHVFATTLAENLRLARPDASDEALLAGLDRAHLGAWLAGLPDGLETWIGDAHTGLSGGERARLALARAVLADPEILVLDEPVAHLDDETAAATASALLDHEGERSVVWITHRTVGLEHMDAVIDLGALQTQS